MPPERCRSAVPTFQPHMLRARIPMPPQQKRAAGIARGPLSSKFHLVEEFSNQDRRPPGRSCRSGVHSYCAASDLRFPGHHPHSNPHIIQFSCVTALVKKMICKRTLNVKIKMPCSAILIMKSMAPHIPFVVSPSGDFSGPNGPTTNKLHQYQRQNENCWSC